MKLSTKIATIIACAMPLVACESTRGSFDSTPMAPPRYQHESRPFVSSEIPVTHPMRHTVKTTVVKTTSDPEVTMVEHGVSTSVSPKTAALVKSPNSQSRPMVPGGAPSIE